MEERVGYSETNITTDEGNGRQFIYRTYKLSSINNIESHNPFSSGKTRKSDTLKKDLCLLLSRNLLVNKYKLVSINLEKIRETDREDIIENDNNTNKKEKKEVNERESKEKEFKMNLLAFRDFLLSQRYSKCKLRFFCMRESVEKLKQICYFYQSYMKFKCNPFFLRVKSGKLIKSAKDEKALVYKQNKYPDKAKRSDINQAENTSNFDDKIFSNSIKRIIEEKSDSDGLFADEIIFDDCNSRRIDNVEKSFKERESSNSNSKKEDKTKLNFPDYSVYSKTSSKVSRNSLKESYKLIMDVFSGNEQVKKRSESSYKTNSSDELVDSFEEMKNIDRKDRERHMTISYNLTTSEKTSGAKETQRLDSDSGIRCTNFNIFKTMSHTEESLVPLKDIRGLTKKEVTKKKVEVTANTRKKPLKSSVKQAKQKYNLYNVKAFSKEKAILKNRNHSSKPKQNDKTSMQINQINASNPSTHIPPQTSHQTKRFSYLNNKAKKSFDKTSFSKQLLLKGKKSSNNLNEIKDLRVILEGKELVIEEARNVGNNTRGDKGGDIIDHNLFRPKSNSLTKIQEQPIRKSQPNPLQSVNNISSLNKFLSSINSNNSHFRKEEKEDKQIQLSLKKSPPKVFSTFNINKLIKGKKDSKEFKDGRDGNNKTQTVQPGTTPFTLNYRSSAKANAIGENEEFKPPSLVSQSEAGQTPQTNIVIQAASAQVVPKSKKPPLAITLDSEAKIHSGLTNYQPTIVKTQGISYKFKEQGGNSNNSPQNKTNTYKIIEPDSVLKKKPSKSLFQKKDK